MAPCPKTDHSLVRKRKFHPLLKKLSIQQCGFHAFRHGNATLLDQINAPMAVRLNRLGHAEAQTAMGYTHIVTSDERKTAEELGKILHVNARNDESEVLAAKPLTLRIQLEVGCGGVDLNSSTHFYSSKYRKSLLLETIKTVVWEIYSTKLAQNLPSP